MSERTTWKEFLDAHPVANEFYRANKCSSDHVLDALLKSQDRAEQVAILEMAFWYMDGDSGYGCFPDENWTMWVPGER